MLVALWLGGGAAPTVIADAGPVVRWTLPVVKLLSNLGAAAMLGSLVLALFALRAGDRSFDVAMDTASVGAAVYTVASAIAAFFTFLLAFPVTVDTGPEFGAQFGRFLTELDLGRAWLITVIGGAIVTIATFAFRSWTMALLTALLAAATFVPLATQGHAGELSGHEMAVNSLLLHTLGAAVWVGGLLLLIVLRGTRTDLAAAEEHPVRGKERPVAIGAVLRRYSALALVAYIVIAVSGIARTVISVGTWSGLWTPYGALVAAKAVLLVLLGCFGAWYRTRLIPRIDASAEGRTGKGAAARRTTALRSFWTLVLAELALMGAASGAAVALARTPPPTGDQVPTARTPAEFLTGSPVPPELTFGRWFTQWDLDLIWALAAVFGAVLYLLGVRRLRRRGDAWPIHRTILWLAGMLLLLWVTGGAVNAYQEYLFSVHMLGHMILSMALPLLLVSGAPVTLALRAIDKRDDGTRGAREWILWAVHTPFSRVVTHPFVAAAIFVLSLWAFYFTDIVRWVMNDHLGHEWMTIHFLIAGYLFVLSLIGVDPVPYRLPYPGRLITLIAVMATHAFFGVAIMMQTGLIVAEWFGSMGRTWGATPMEDQYVGGGIAWSVGEIPTLILAITVAIQWSRSDARAEKRRDRHADRTGDAELAEYNAHLAELAERDRRLAERGR
ncbi:cytochrome c oxidase assembly protein [Microbacterium pseudoresistens]|nr:cytochrome c oxidase assembly protein [Microbacterium pseudoresistens]